MLARMNVHRGVCIACRLAYATYPLHTDHINWSNLVSVHSHSIIASEEVRVAYALRKALEV